ncbi:hypothetical protein WICMUC_003194 [Wickerhamomyces mucosus]|uniref:Nudix hydrolase domain-containing protein n=1 Tax=Wickerhamomyces mucosus TaxID=1378264 RepID=A0A9P8PM45_9ASCO|nr:hypothetical protein WICMUC_003194 [Wickerhamomyces mucosus]
MSIPLKNGFVNETLDRALEDILVRFIINSPPEDLSDNSRVFFLFEEAHWFYLDYVRSIHPYLPQLKMKSFCKKLIEIFPLIWKGDSDPEEGLKEFINYKQTIPVRGAALFNSSLDKILLVQGTESSSWSFPRGKISKDEDDLSCAIREVKEEIGFDIGPFTNENEYIERTIRNKNYKIYLCRDIPEDFEFKPQVRNEINDIQWKDFKWIYNRIRKSSNPGLKFFLIQSIVTPLWDWVKRNRGDFNEAQLKLQVELQLKQLLGIGTTENIKEPTADPGRELLDLIRKSAAKKQEKDEQFLSQLASKKSSSEREFQQLQQLGQSQYPNQVHLQSQPQLPFPPPGLPFFPIPPPIPGFGFQPPPLSQLPFINPFVPPPTSAAMPFLQTIPAPFRLQSPLPNGNKSVYEQPPNPGEFKRPSFIVRKEGETKELLSILNKKADSKKEESSVQRSSDTHNDYSKNLLALLNKKTDGSKIIEKSNSIHKGEGDRNDLDSSKLTLDSSKPKLATESPTSFSPRPIQDNKPKQKFKILKRENPKSEVKHEETSFDAPKASKELLNLIKKSNEEVGQDQENVEMFEDITDEEEDELETFSNKSIRGDFEDLDKLKNIDRDYENDRSVAGLNIDDTLLTKIADPRPKGGKSTSSAPQGYETPKPTKKFTILKRGETLPKLEEPKEKIEKPTEEAKLKVSNPVDSKAHPYEEFDNESGTSTIQFSDDDDVDNVEFGDHENREDLYYEKINTGSDEDLASGESQEDMEYEQFESFDEDEDQDGEKEEEEGEGIETTENPDESRPNETDKLEFTDFNEQGKDLGSVSDKSSFTSPEITQIPEAALTLDQIEPEYIKSTTPRMQQQNSTQQSNELLNLSKGQPGGSEIPATSKASNDLLELLKIKTKPEPEGNIQPFYSIKSRDDREVFSKKSQTFNLNPDSTVDEPQSFQSTRYSTPTNDPSSSLLNLLHKNTEVPHLSSSGIKSEENSNSSGPVNGENELLNILHSNASSNPVTHKLPESTNGSAANDLLSLLRSEPVRPNQTSKQVLDTIDPFGAPPKNKEDPSKSLMDLLFRK